MKILPTQTDLPPEPIARRHVPRPATWDGGYATYRPCMRWDFSFCCAFCSLHEADIFRLGSSGRTGLFATEHIIPQSSDNEARNDYQNCVYCCRFCNRSRSIAPLVDADGAILLNPTETASSEHFTIQLDEIQPVDGDADAEYTHLTYQLNDPIKAAYRRARRETVSECLTLVRECDYRIRRVHRLLQDEEFQNSQRDELFAQLQLYTNTLRMAVGQLMTYRLIPSDADKNCRCEVPPKYTVASWLSSTSVELTEHH